MRILLDEEPFLQPEEFGSNRSRWPAEWIGPARGTVPLEGVPGFEEGERPELPGRVWAFRRRFALAEPARVRLHVSADERYDLWLDGERIGRGPERGDRFNWFYESYEAELEAGEHVLVARVWYIGPLGPPPAAQVSLGPGFVLASDSLPPGVVNTGRAEWEYQTLEGYVFLPAPGEVWNTGARLRLRGREGDQGFATGEGEDWAPAAIVGPARGAEMVNDHPPVWLLRRALLPPMYEARVQVGRARQVQALAAADPREVPVRAADHLSEEAAAWDAWLAGRGQVVIPARSRRRVIVDLGEYYCAYPELTVSGGRGSRLRLHWAEGLLADPETRAKGNRDEIEGKYFRGAGDVFEPDGGVGRRYETLWWEPGRYLEFLVTTAEEPLTLVDWALRETHYPWEWQEEFAASDERLAQFMPLARRSVEMCTHETYMDCPYYEQLQYVGDTRLQVLYSYVCSREDRLPRKALRMFDQSRLVSGLTRSQYPSRWVQIIPPFSLWWVAMVHDFALWRDDPAFVASLMPGVRAVLEAYRGWVQDDELVTAPEGWNFMDWVPEWQAGIPPDGHTGISGVLTWQLVLVLRMAAQLEDWQGETELAQRNRALAQRVAGAARGAFFDTERGLLADDLAHRSFSEHSQCLALLAEEAGAPLFSEEERLRLAAGLLTAPDLARTTIYFSHYLFETYRLLGVPEAFLKRMELWLGLRGLGLRTTLEAPEPARSDCHAWGAHPVFHYFATVLGLRPGGPGFRTARLEPQLGPLEWARGTMAHPQGVIRAEVWKEGEEVVGRLELPEGVQEEPKVEREPGSG